MLRADTRSALPAPPQPLPQCRVGAQRRVLPNPRGSPWPRRAKKTLPVFFQPALSGAFPAQDGQRTWCERIPLRIPASPPRLPSTPPPLTPLSFNYIQGSFTGFIITLVAFRNDISSAENIITVPETSLRFIWVLPIHLQIVSTPRLLKEGNNFYLCIYIYMYIHTLWNSNSQTEWHFRI